MSAEPKQLGRGMVIAAWVLVLALLTAYFSGVLEHQNNPNASVDVRTGDNGAVEVVLKRNRFGHYVATGEVNGRPVELMLDTGATDVAIPARLATRLDLKRGGAVQYRTANGVVTGYRTRIDTLSIGPITFRNVPASINPGIGDDQILLGMSALKEIEFSQRGDMLILSVPSS